MEILTQICGGQKKPVVNLLKIMDPFSGGWAECVQAIDATTLLVKEGCKLTFEGVLVVSNPHYVRFMQNQKVGQWSLTIVGG